MDGFVFYTMIRERLTAKMTFIKRPRRIPGIVGKRRKLLAEAGQKPWVGTCCCTFKKKQGACVDGTREQGG